MTTRNVLIAAAAVTVLAVTTACGSSTKPAASSEPITTPPPTSSATTTTSAASTTAVTTSPACAVLGGTVGGDNLCTVHTEKPGYTIDMSFPVDYPDQSAVADLLKKQRDGFISAAEEPPVSTMPKALDIKSTTNRAGTPENGTESVVFEEYVNLAGAHPTTSYEALNYDLGKKAPITFETLFNPASNPVAVLDPLVGDALKAQLSGIPLDPNGIGPDMYKNFALTDDAVTFLISQGQWAISAAGAQKVSIPRSELTSILAA